MLVMFVGHILRDMRMMRTEMARGMPRNLHTILREHEDIGSHHLDEYQDHPLDLDLGLLTFRPGQVDE